MKAAIQDKDILYAVRPLELVSYLRASGWSLAQETDKATYWERNVEDGGTAEILVPRRNDFADFPARISEALHTLEILERRSQLEILDDLNTANADVVRIRTHSRDGANDGSIALEDGVLLCEKVRELVVAAACATIDKSKSVFSNRKPDQAISYLRKVRLGQTERGSYVFTLISPVTPELQGQQGALFEVKEPFEREVMQTLAQSLAAALQASQSSGQTGSMKPFSEAVKLGVNANLLEAVVGLSEGSGNQDVEVKFSWSRSRATPPEIPRRIAIPQDVIPVVKEAARVFRETAPQEDFALFGKVIALSSDDPENKGGKITILGMVEDKPRKVAVILHPSEYSKAIEAHEKSGLVSCQGELLKEKGAYFLLQNPREFELLDEN